jgi:hypothetical protein
MLSCALPILLVAASPAPPPAAGLVIESDSACPSAAAVRAALVGLRPRDDWPPANVGLVADEQSLRVTLDGSRARQVTVGSDCLSRAATVAVIVATWLGEFPAEAATAPVLQPVQPPTLPSNPQPRPPAPPRHRQEVGAGLLATLSGGMVAGGRVEYARLRPDGRLGWQVSLAWPAPREVAIAGARTRFTRAAVNVAVRGALPIRRFLLSGDAGLAAGYTLAWGQGYDTDQTDQSLTYGATAGVRAGLPWRNLSIWTDVRTFKWLYGQSVQIDSADGTTTEKVWLPTWDVHWALGVSYLF